MITAENLKVNILENPNSLTPGKVRFSWVSAGASQQTGFSVTIREGSEAIYQSGKIPSDARTFEPPFQTQGGSSYSCELQLIDENGEAGPPAAASFGTVLNQLEWKAKWIDPEPDRQEAIKPKKNLLTQFNKLILKKEVGIPRYPASYLRKRFHVSENDLMQSCRLNITAHGLYTVKINGSELKDWVLAPGFTQYDHLLNVQAYDVAAFLHRGENEILVTLGDGWYRGSLNNERDLNSFGSDVALLCQLRCGEDVVMVSDESWATTNEGPLGLNDLQLGEHYDARRSLENASWHDVAVRDFALDNLVGSDCQPIREQEQFPARLIHTPNGEKVLDFGQNFAGYVRMEFDARGSETLILTHGESLDKNGNFTQANILAPTKPAAYQQVFYTCKQGRNVYQPSMCFFGFRYVRVETSMEVNPEWFTGVAVYSDMKQTAQFSCGNEKVNQLFQNCLWSMKSNFISVMTDCPTRERSGYTGDGQVFCPSGLYLMDCSPVYRHWLQSLKQVFLPDGGLKMFAPERQPASFMDSSHGWCDAIVIIPYLLWKRSGDLQFAADHFDDGKKWVDFALKRASSGSHNVGKRLPKELQPYFADQGFTFGEWLEFSNSSLIAGIIDILKHMLFGEPETATAYLSYSSHLLSQMAAALGKTEDAARYAHAAGMTRQAYRAAYIENGIIREPVRQCRYVRPLALGLLDEGEKPLAVERLVECIVKAGNHLNTGFLSTAYLCRMLSDHGRAAKAYDLLLQETLPSWLYEVKKGATTVWENWRGIDENGKLNNSFNHYSLGAISGWLMDSVCGIRVEDGSLTLAPKPDQRLGFAEGSYESAIGKIRSAWRYEGNALILEGEIPCGIHATLELPGGESKILQSGQYQIFVKETVGM